MELAAGLFLAACAAAGFGVTYLSGIGLELEERVLYGAVLGALVVAVPSFLASLAMRDVTLATTAIGLAFGVGIGALGIATSWPRLTLDAAAARARWLAPLQTPGHPWPLAAILLVCGAWTIHFFHQAYVYTPAGLYTGYVNIWGDWAAHLSFAGSFAYGHNFPPQFPIDPGNHLGYPFMLDYFAAELIPLGLPLTEALTGTSAMLALALPGVLYLAALRFAGWRAAAAIAVFVFLLSGGLGFVYLFGGSQRYYTMNGDANLQWFNPVLAYLIPQRTTLSGLALALVILVTIWLAAQRPGGWRPFLFAGIITGVMPLFHVHAYGTVVALSAFWAVMNRRREWIALFAPAFAIGVPILAWLWPPANNSVCGSGPSIAGFCIALGWYTPGDVVHDGPFVFTWNFITFWIWNTSLLVPLMLAAYALRHWFPTAFPKWFAPMWLWFVVPNVIVLQPWIWDNTKFFIFWALLGSVLAGGVLAGMLRSGTAAAAAAIAAMVLLGLSGLVDVVRLSDYSVSSVEFTDAGGLKVADWVRHNTSPYAVFAVADDHNNPIPTLAGRREVIGYAGWLWTYGVADYLEKGADNKKILGGDPSAAELVRKYSVDYVMIGPQEISVGASRAYWDQHGTIVYEDSEYAVYRVSR